MVDTIREMSHGGLPATHRPADSCSASRRTPSLSRSSDCHSTTAEASSGPNTPPPSQLDAHAYSLPVLEVPIMLSAGPTALVADQPLPDILDPSTAAYKPIKNVCCIGAGYVGGPTAAVIALHNADVRVTVVDRDERRIKAWRSKHLPIHEPGLIDVVRLARDGSFKTRKITSELCQDDGTWSPIEEIRESIRQPNLFFSTACVEAIAAADLIFVSVNTPTKRRGVGAGRATDMSAFEGAIRDVALHAKTGAIIVEKSTVPCRTGQLIKEILEAHRPGVEFPVLSNPEFLAEGTAIRDLFKADRVVIGCEETVSGCRAAAALANLYAAWVPRSRILPINLWSSELCKLVANAMLAQRISSINSVSALCERTGARINDIAKAVGLDSRIGPQFLKAGLGFGGSCFRKDIASLTYLAESMGLPEVSEYWQAVLTMNDFQRNRFAKRVIARLNNSLRGKKITILGYAFKKDTDDARESPALDVIRILLEETPARIAIYDPLCSRADIKRELSVLEDGAACWPDGPVEVFTDPHLACDGSSAVLVLTDWDMFRTGQPTAAASKAPCHPSLVHIHGNPTADEILQIDELLEALQLPNATPPTPPATCPTSPKQKHFQLPAEILEGLVPEPVCSPDCVECASIEDSTVSLTGDTQSPLDWCSISRIVKEPRWVFDGRGMFDAKEMADLGFSLESIGRASG